MRLTLFAIAAIALVSGCTGSSPVTQSTTVNLPSTYSLSNNENGTFTVSDGVTSVVLTEIANELAPGTRTFAATDGPALIRRDTPGGFGTATALLWPQADAPAVVGAILDARGLTTLARSDTVAFTGRSATFFGPDGSEIGEGRVDLTAAFGAGTIQGGITERTVVISDLTFTMDDIVFETGTISAGAFSGTATVDTFTGTYSGVFVSPNAGELIGEWGYDTEIWSRAGYLHGGAVGLSSLLRDALGLVSCCADRVGIERRSYHFSGK